MLEIRSQINIEYHIFQSLKNTNKSDKIQYKFNKESMASVVNIIKCTMQDKKDILPQPPSNTMVVSINKTQPLNVYEVKIKASRLTALLVLLVVIFAFLCIQETFNKGQKNDGRISGFSTVNSKSKNISMIMSKKGEKLLNIRKTEVTDVSNLQKLRSKFYRSYRPRYRHNTLRFLALTYLQSYNSLAVLAV